MRGVIRLKIELRTCEEDGYDDGDLVDDVSYDVLRHSPRYQRLGLSVRLAIEQLIGRILGRQA